MIKQLCIGVAVASALTASGVAQWPVTAQEARAGSPSRPCDGVAKLRLSDVKISEAAAAAPAGPITAPHCRVNGVIGREIRFTLLMPDTWNQRFVMGGGGGFVGTIDNQAQTSVNSGYATVGTDTGHQGVVFMAGWALNDLERQVNFGHLAVHRVAEVAKAIIREYYAADPIRSYFVGCSNGGRQAMMEAQRYPDDFDGVVAGAPAMDFVGIAAQFIRDARVLFPDGKNLTESLFTTALLKFYESKMLAACDAADGVTDGVLDDPRTCRFDPASVPTCATDHPGPDCLTKRQQAALKAVYAPTTNRDGVIYPAQPLGGESEPAGWPSWITGPNQQVYALSKMPTLRFAFGTEFFKYFVFNDPSWDYTKYDLSTWKQDTKLAATILNATDPNLDTFKSKGHKTILWHGWSDPALTPLGSVKYFEQVQARDANVRDYFRMFMAPGVLHCGGGPGPDRVDWPSVLADWVEKGKAPESVIASKVADNQVVRTRPLCSYPQRAVYSGRGSTDDAANFSCKQP